MPKKPRVPVPDNPREVEDWRIRLAADIGEALTQDDVLGTVNQVVVTANANGTITLSLPQDIDTNADVEFDSLVLDDLSPSNLVATDANNLLVSVADLSAWILGTANQVIVTSNGDGTVTLSLPQDIDTDADVTFDTISIDKVVFTLTAGLTPAEGEMCWNSDDGTVNIGMPGSDVVLQIGQETLAPRSRAVGSNIANGELVYVSGATGAIPEMTLAKADASATASGTIAMATEAVAQNQLGFFTAFGLVRDVNTDPVTYTAGDQLYLSSATAGAYTNVKPVAPGFVIKIGVVIRAHATEGSIFVNISQRTNNFVNIRGLTANSVPYADSNGFLTESNPGITFDGTHFRIAADSAKIYLGAGSDFSLFYDGTDANLKTNEVAASDLLLTCGANKTLELQNTVYEDNQVSISGVRIPTSNAPTWRQYNHGIVGGVTFPVLGFALNEYFYFDIQTYHAMKLSTILDNHIHFMTPTDGSATPDRFNFQLDVIVAAIDGNWAVPTGSPFTSEHTISADYTNLHKVHEIADIPASNTTVSTIYKCKLTRIAASQDEYAGEVYIEFNDSHYQKNTMGSRQEGAK